MKIFKYVASLAGALALTVGLVSASPSAEAGRESNKPDVQTHDRGASIGERHIERRANRGQGRVNRSHRRANRAERRSEPRTRTRTRSERRATTGERRVDRSQRRINRSDRRIKRSERRIKRGDGRVNRNRNRIHRYERRRHGKRYRHRRNNHRDYYNGFYYASPWWLYSAPILSYGGSDWDLHVAWCHDRYRSYNERRDAFKGYDGIWHTCISPYS